MNLPNAELQIRIYGLDGSLSVFTQDDPLTHRLEARSQFV